MEASSAFQPVKLGSDVLQLSMLECQRDSLNFNSSYSFSEKVRRANKGEINRAWERKLDGWLNEEESALQSGREKDVCLYLCD